MSLRLTFIEGKAIRKFTHRGLTASGQVLRNEIIKPGVRSEFRDEEGEIIRMAHDGELSLVESPLGVHPELYGEVCVLNVAMRNGKYRTSCYLKSSGASRPDILIKPISDDVDEFSVFTGEISITEYDESNISYTICMLREGEKCKLKFNPMEEGKKRYNVISVDSIPDKEYDYFMNKYLDGRNWK